MTTNNPLAGYFRQPAIHLHLPSDGQFYPDGAIEMPETHELKVYPMSSMDEITYKTPDALFNGSAVIDVIKSCVPDITDPWAIPSIDLPAILTAIRIASFDNTMEINTTCPKCSEHSTYEIDLNNVLDSLKSPDYSKSLKIGELEIFFKPLSYKQINENNILRFEEQRLNKTITDVALTDDEKLKIMSESFKKIASLTMNSLANNINEIRTPGATVNEHEFILDFLQQCEREIYKAIKDHAVELRDEAEIKPLKITCDNDKCKHKYDQPFTMDMSTFFE